jgi:hypothetical protein
MRGIDDRLRRERGLADKENPKALREEIDTIGR